MTVNGNIGSAILLLGILWFGYHYGFSTQLLLLGILILFTWGYPTGANEAKDLLRAQARYYQAKARFYEMRKE